MPEKPQKPRSRPGPPRERPRPPKHGRRGPAHDVRGPRLGLGIRMVFEDDEILVVDKPAGVVTAVLPGEAGAAPDVPSVFGEVKRYVRVRRKSAVRVWVIHRLDKEASGLLVFAKTERAFAWLKEDFRARRAHRLYMAVVENEFAAEAMSGTLQGFVAEDQTGLMRGVANRKTLPGRDQPPPQLAVTHYRVIAQGHGLALLQVRLRTGRKNQIRVQMSEAGHPLVGDYRYRPPGPPRDPLKRLGLHASELGFAHPTKGETVRFTSPAPAEFWSVVGATPPAHGQDTSDAPAAPGPHSTPLPPPPMPTASSASSIPTSWDHVAGWYENLLDRGRSDHQRDVILPGALRLLRPQRGMRVLDVACGEGALCRRLGALGVEAVGVDASARLVQAARGAGPGPGSPALRFEVGDARRLDTLNLGRFDGASCVMALMNIDPIEPVLRGIADLLRPGGVFVAVILHPAFRSPGQTSWGWDQGNRHSASPDEEHLRQHGQRRTGRHEPRGTPGGPPRRAQERQYRRVDGYLSHGQSPIIMNPGAAAHGKDPVTTWTFHRPIQAYVKALAESGFVLEALEEWPTMRQSQPGPRAGEENRARREIPMFLGFRALKRGSDEGPPGGTPG